MFFYFSFLRIPQSCSQLVFTPKVTNNLRTEPFPTIYYRWISYAPEPQNIYTKLSEPAKLTTWRQENAYKTLRIPRPPSKKLNGEAVGSGIDCGLVLAPAPNVASSVDPEIGRAPLPVCSLPIKLLPPPLLRTHASLLSLSKVITVMMTRTAFKTRTTTQVIIASVSDSESRSRPR
jgi:protein N-lysine methyltransferase METTL21D